MASALPTSMLDFGSLEIVLHPSTPTKLGRSQIEKSGRQVMLFGRNTALQIPENSDIR